MRKLVLILMAFIAVVTFIRAFDNSSGINTQGISSQGIQPAGIHSETLHANEGTGDISELEASR